MWYDAGGRATAVVQRDLQTIRSAGFNHIEVPVSWASAEPERGRYRFDTLDRLLTLARQAGLEVTADPRLEPAPAWIVEPPADPWVVRSFLEALASHAARHPSFHPTDARLSAFATAIDARPATSPPVEALWRLDALRTAAGERGWKVAQLRVAPDATGADLRLWGWTALAHGARAITYFPWYPRSGAAGAGLVNADGTPAARARAAGELAGIVSRNATLFASLRPRRSRAALVYNPLWEVMPLVPAAVAQHDMLQVYAQLLERNIQADIVFPDAIAAGAAARYRAVFASAPAMLPPPPRAALDAYERAGGAVLAARESHGAAARVVEPDIRVDGGGLVNVRLLESADALVLIAINHRAAPARVTFRFAPELPEAIWQNMESGASVSFVRRADGLTHTHAFAARDALVLAIRKPRP